MSFRFLHRPLTARPLPLLHLHRPTPLSTTAPLPSIPKPSNTPPPPSKPPTRPRPLHLPPLAATPPSDLTEAFLKGSGPGGQKINKTSSAVQLKHLPTGIVIKCQATRSRSQNRKIARKLLAERLEVLEKGAEARVSVKGERERRRKASRGKKARRKYRALGGEREEGEGDGEDGEGEGDEEGVRDGEEWLDEGEEDAVKEGVREGGAPEERLVGYVEERGRIEEGGASTNVVKNQTTRGKIKEDGKWIKMSKHKTEVGELHRENASEESVEDGHDDTRGGKGQRDEELEKWLQEELEIKEIAAQSMMEPGQVMFKKKKKKKKPKGRSDG